MSAPQISPEYLPGLDLMSLAGVPVIYHCHHFNLFLDQTIDDALGPVEGPKVRFEAAREAFHELLSATVALLDVDTPASRVQVSRELLARMGHGRVDLDAGARGGAASAAYLHYGFTWREKYGGLVGRSAPADAVGAGFAAAATEVAFRLPRDSVEARETSCVAAKAPQCTFELIVGAQANLRRPCLISDYELTSKALFDGLWEDRIHEITQGLRGFLAGVGGDERGLVEAFGVFVTMHLAGYYNRVTYDAISGLQARAPRAIKMIEVLLRESGHVCVFNTFGGILRSPEWEAMVGSPRTPEDVVLGCVAIARALGFGHWTVERFEAGRQVVLRTPSSYEAGYYLSRHGRSERPNDYFFQGAVMAIAQLAHRVDWTSPQAFTQDFYESLFRGEVPWTQEPQTHCLACGHDYSQVSVVHT